MRLTHLSLTDFRNFTRLDMDVPPGALLLTGNNAQGKTSLLEAIYYLATFVSFHADSDRQLINFLAGRASLAVARIIGDFERAGSAHRLEVRLIQDGTNANALAMRKEILLDGAKRKSSETVGQFNAVLFLPQSTRVIEGAPDERRRYLNLTLSQVIGAYPPTLTEYTRTLTQRNALLKQLADRGGDASQLDFWDQQLVSAGAKLIQARIQAIQEIERLAARLHLELSHGAEVLRFSYQPSYDPLPRPNGQISLPFDLPADRSAIPLEQIRQGFFEQLVQRRREEITRGVTTIGPHRDEVRFFANGIDLGTYGSRGQIRTAILSLKLAEVAWMKEKTGHRPVLLLDEVLAELDAQRRTDLLARLDDGQQYLLTTTDLELFAHPFIAKAARWNVSAGRVEKVS